MKSPIWITWEKQRRNRELSRSFNFKLYELSEIDKIQNRLIKYIIGVSKTYFIICKERPRIVCCQNPSIILPLSLLLLRLLFGFKVWVDAHNSGLFPINGRSSILNYISKIIQRNADLTIVTNRKLKDYVTKNGGQAFVLPDKIPSIPTLPSIKLEGKNNLLFVCTFSDDEPYELIFQSAYELGKKTFIYVTGDFTKSNIANDILPENVILMGYISDFEYEKMLSSVDGVIDLTTRDNCLVCGAYESAAVGKPMILSNTEALKKYFNMGALFTDHSSKSLVNAINELIAKNDILTSDITKFKELCNSAWELKAERLATMLHTISC